MAISKLYHRARMTVSGTPGTGTITLGSASAGFQSFATAGVANADLVSYLITDGNAWELGQGTYTSSGTTLARTTIDASSNSGSAVSLTSAAIVSLTALKRDFDRVPVIIEAIRTTNQAITTATWTAVSWSSFSVDDTGVASLSSATRLVVPTGYTQAKISASSSWEGNNTGSRYAKINKNSNGTDQTDSFGGFNGRVATDEGGSLIQTRWVTGLTGGTDYFEFFVYQNSGSNKNLIGPATSVPGSSWMCGEFRP